MPFHPSPASGSTTAKPRTWNRGDLLILACGLVAFLILAFLSGPGPSVRSGVAGAPPAAASAVVAESPTRGAPEAGVAGLGNGVPGTAGSQAEAAAEAGAGQPPALPPAAAPLRIVYPAAGIDVAVHPLEPSPGDIASQTIVPPVSFDGYWVTTFGAPGAGSVNTTYIMGHSWEDQDAPFNRLSSAAAPGDILDVRTTAGRISYRVDSISTENKSTLKDHQIWQVVPNRLVLISCYTEDLFGKNVVLVASPAPASAP
ncbi:class F sortase [Arthrobacter sp. UYEF36]|uniref:class F sortase n=1 Tax=Arthrobacter sp. UYEF36 TaxID=1756366 RepID=UPI003391C64C